MTRKQDTAPLRTVHALRFTLYAPRATFAAVAVSLLLGASAVPASTPYQPIVERNVFGLKPPPPPPDPETLKPPPSKITLTGIMTIFGKKQALMKTPPSPAPPPKPGQPAEPPKEHSYMLAEGQGEDGITVLQIDTVAKTVKVDNGGHVETLMFLTNAPMATAAPAGVPSPTGFNNGMPQPVNAPRMIPRPLRIPTAGGGSAATSIGGSAGSTGVADAGQPNTGAYGYNGVAGSAQQQASAAPQRSLEENVALAEINATKNEQMRAAGIRVPPIPHHPLAAGMYGDSSEGQPQQQAPAQRMPFHPGMPQLPQ